MIERFLNYTVNGTTYKAGQTTPTSFATANGYRLPAEVEWEWAARGGISSQGYTLTTVPQSLHGLPRPDFLGKTPGLER